MAEPFPDRERPDPSGRADPTDGADPRAEARAEAVRAAAAATTALRPLFPATLAHLAGDPRHVQVAELVRVRTRIVVRSGGYRLDAFVAEDSEVVGRLAAEIVRWVPGALPSACRSLPDLDRVVAELVDHRLAVSPDDRAGRRLCAPADGFDLLAWAGRIRMAPIGREPTDLLAFSDLEISYFVSRRQDAVVAEMTSRSRQRWLLGNFASDDDALRFLVMRIGADWRSATGRRPLPPGEPVPGTTLEDGPTATHLTWPDGWADFPRGLAGRAAALGFARVVGLTPARIADLYLGPPGRRPPDA